MKLVALVALAFGCGGAPTPPTPAAGAQTGGGGRRWSGRCGCHGNIRRSAYGTAHPAVLRAFDRDERWMAMCQAHKDTEW